MGGGLLQLYSKGPQDVFLTGNPTITFFKKVYRKHTNLAVEEMEQVFVGEKIFGKRIRCKIERKGDLLKDMYLKIKLKNGNGNNPEDNYKNIIKCGFALIDYVEIEIGGQTIDKHYGEWLDIWTQLSMTSEKYNLMRNLIRDRRNTLDIWEGPDSDNIGDIYIPLFFWFNNDPGLALPLISLQYHELVLYLKLKKKEDVKIIIETTIESDKYNILPALADNNNQAIAYTNEGEENPKKNVTKADYQSFITNPSINDNTINPKNNKWYIKSFTGEIVDIVVICSYIFLDKDERKKFAKNSHEYLITQVQRTSKLDLPKLTSDEPKKNTQIRLEFNHPVKEIIWTAQSKLLENTFIYKNMDFSNSLSEILLQLNGIDRIPKSDAYYYTNIVPYRHHTCGGLLPKDNNHYYTGGFYCYSFSLNPENYQPSGSLNFSNIKNFTINFDYNKTSNNYSTLIEPYVFTCYGLNYNILRIQNGMGGLAYTN